jgi:excinuclease ABC subunit C
MTQTSMQIGINAILSVQKTLSDRPGVYRMLGGKQDVLYVGKAKSLKKRVMSYTRPDKLPMRLKRMISETRLMEIIETRTELEALLLEFNLIKELDPKYNVMYKDDKAYPYVLIPHDHDFPRVVKHRGAKKIKGDYYGPFASAGAVNRSIDIMHKVFQIRNCTDNNFANRTRPCLQYHIKRCTAPCVGYVTKDEYAKQMDDATAFLKGDGGALKDRFAEDMKQASDAQDFERAAQYRDKIKTLATMQASQIINMPSVKNADIFAIVTDQGLTGISVFFIRNGQNFGNRAYFPKTDGNEKTQDVLGQFLVEFYARNPIAPEIFVNIIPTDHDLIAQTLEKELNRQVSIIRPQRGEKTKLIDMAESNAISTLQRHKAQESHNLAGLSRVKEIFDLPDLPKRIEVYDNSHTSGDHMLGAMIVATQDGFNKSAYRKFNIREADASDDYGMMREVMQRRFGRALKEGHGVGSDQWPDIVLIDGGKGQLSVVTEVFEDLGILDDITLVSIAKGPDRNAGREDFYMNGRTPFKLPPNDVGLFYLQRLRDEAHRFAIGSMRTRRSKAIEQSPLDGVPGIGPKRKKALLSYFGSGKAVTTASLDDLQKVDGVSKAFAQKIYDYFHE